MQSYKYNDGGEPIADAAKLWYYFDDQGDGFFGILITVFLYFFHCFMAGAILYMYFLRYGGTILCTYIYVCCLLA